MTPLERKRREDLGLRDGDDLDMELGLECDQSGTPAPAIEPLPMGKADPRGPFGSKALGPDYGPFTGNVYFYWFEYMKAYPGYRDSVGMSASVQPRQALRDFDIQADEDFPSWWDRKGADLFYDLYEDESHAIEVSPKADKSDLGDGLLVYLPIDGSILVGR
jgi:hypothetical protein